MAQGSIQFMQLPALQANRLLDFSPVNNAVTSVDNKLRYREKMNIEAEEKSYQRGRDAASDQRQQVELFGKQAAAVARMSPEQRAAIWPRLLAKHPNQAGLDKSYLDPTTGPELVMAEAGQWIDPNDQKRAQLEIQKTEAEIAKLNAQAANGGTEYGRSGTIVQDPKTGQFYSVQWGSDGQKKVEPLAIGGTNLQPSRGTDVVGDTIIDKATGADVRNVAPQIAAGERAKVVGRESGEGQMQLPKTATALEQYELQDDAVNAAIDKATALADGTAATGVGSQVTGFVGGTPAYNLGRQLDTIKGNIGFDKLQNLRDNSPTGGALGQVAVQELQMLQAVLGSLDQAQSADQFKEGLAEIKVIRKRFRQMKREAYQRDVERFGKANVPNPDGGNKPADDGWTTINGVRIREKR